MHNLLLERVRIGKAVLEGVSFKTSNALDYRYVMFQASDAEIEELSRMLDTACAKNAVNASKMISAKSLCADMFKGLNLNVDDDMPVINIDRSRLLHDIQQPTDADLRMCKESFNVTQRRRLHVLDLFLQQFIFSLTNSADFGYALGPWDGEKRLNYRARDFVSNSEKQICKERYTGYKDDGFYSREGFRRREERKAHTFLPQYFRNIDFIELLSSIRDYSTYTKRIIHLTFVVLKGDMLHFGLDICGFAAGIPVSNYFKGGKKRMYETWCLSYLTIPALFALCEKIAASNATTSDLVSEKKACQYILSFKEPLLIVANELLGNETAEYCFYEQSYKEFCKICAVSVRVLKAIRIRKEDAASALAEMDKDVAVSITGCYDFYFRTEAYDFLSVWSFVKGLNDSSLSLQVRRSLLLLLIPRINIGAFTKSLTQDGSPAFAMGLQGEFITRISGRRVGDWMPDMRVVVNNHDAVLIGGAGCRKCLQETGVSKVQGFYFFDNWRVYSEFEELPDGKFRIHVKRFVMDVFNTKRVILGASFLEWLDVLHDTMQFDNFVYMDYESLFKDAHMTLLCSEDTKDAVCAYSDVFEPMCYVVETDSVANIVEEEQGNAVIQQAFGVDVGAGMFREKFIGYQCLTYLLTLGDLDSKLSSMSIKMTAKMTGNALKQHYTLAHGSKFLKADMEAVHIFAGFELRKAVYAPFRLLWTSAGFLYSPTQNAMRNGEDYYRCLSLSDLWNFLNNDLGWEPVSRGDLDAATYYWGMYWDAKTKTTDVFGYPWRRLYRDVMALCTSRGYQEDSGLLAIYRTVLDCGCRDILLSSSDMRLAMLFNTVVYGIGSYYSDEEKKKAVEAYTKLVQNICLVYLRIPRKILELEDIRWACNDSNLTFIDYFALLGGIQLLRKNSECLLGKDISDAIEYLDVEIK